MAGQWFLTMINLGVRYCPCHCPRSKNTPDTQTNGVPKGQATHNVADNILRRFPHEGNAEPLDFDIDIDTLDWNLAVFCMGITE